MSNTNDKKDLIPVEEVLNDMYDELDILSWSARDYYYMIYATEEERKEMDAEDKMREIMAKIGVVAFAIFIIVALTLK